MKLKALLDESGKRNAELLAVAIDNRLLLQRMVDRISPDGVKPGFTFLSDSGHRVIDRYGLLNPSGQGLPYPTTYVIDRHGVVRWKRTDIDYKVRPTNQMILEALTRLEGR